MNTYDFTQVDFTNPEIADGLGQAYRVLLECRRRTRQLIRDRQGLDAESNLEQTTLRDEPAVNDINEIKISQEVTR